MAFRSGITAMRLRSRLPRVAGKRGTAALVLGIIGLVGMVPGCCSASVLPFAICSVLAWSLGQSELRMYQALGAVGAEESQARAGYVLGIIGTSLACLGMMFWIMYILFVIAAIMAAAIGENRILLITEF